MAVSALDGVPTGQAGTAGMIWISVWAELHAMGLWEDIALLEAGLDHYRGAVLSGELFGAPEDVGECVTSEDVYIAINSFLDGYRVTNRPADLETAVHAARWLYLSLRSKIITSTSMAWMRTGASGIWPISLKIPGGWNSPMTTGSLLHNLPRWWMVSLTHIEAW